MNRRQVLGLGATALLLTACGKGYYRQILQELYREGKSEEADSIQRIIESLIIVDSNNTYKKKGETEVKELKAVGMGVVVGDNIITVDHVVSMYVNFVNTPFGVFAQEIDVLKRETKLDDIVLKEVVRDKEKDVAVFKTPDEYIGASYPFKLGDSDKVQYGQEILLIGNPALHGINVREGIISSKVKDDRLVISANIVPGDSGTAIVDRHTFELLGLSAQRWYDMIAVARPINLFKPYLK